MQVQNKSIIKLASLPRNPNRKIRSGWELRPGEQIKNATSEITKEGKIHKDEIE